MESPVKSEQMVARQENKLVENGKTVLITGGTGFLGQALTKWLLEFTTYNIIVFSRDEFKQWVMESEIADPRVEYVIGDVRDKERITDVAKGVDYIIHAAALKHVWCGEQHPYEVVQTNITGTYNVVQAAKKNGALVIFVSSDKAVFPANLYGATKMVAEKIVLQSGNNVVRYGNVFGSRGSVLHKFNEWAEKGKHFQITDKRMTRFVITIDQAIKLIMRSIGMARGSINIPDLPAIRIVDLAMAFDPRATIEEIGIQPGEKLHEMLSESQSSEHARKLSVSEIQELINATM